MASYSVELTRTAEKQLRRIAKRDQMSPESVVTDLAQPRRVGSRSLPIAALLLKDLVHHFRDIKVALGHRVPFVVPQILFRIGERIRASPGGSSKIVLFDIGIHKGVDVHEIQFYPRMFLDKTVRAIEEHLVKPCIEFLSQCSDRRY
jgi:hypothetical protein